ncbi:MAG: GNAT family N-acetyltransferase [Thioalkalispiraceae bacterium]|jgi:predicted GNAT family N-acyltransferase
MSNFVIKQTRFHDDENAIRLIREQVFINEQHVPVELEWDGLDDEAIHLLVTTNKHPVATARLLADGHIGRMAVLPGFRRQGIGSTMLSRLVELAKQKGLSSVFLSAQVAAIDFYQKHGFTIDSDVYMDAGIPHRDMVLGFTDK